MGKADELSREHFDRTASAYESGREGRMAAALYESVLKKLSDPGCRSVLDVGCGPGTFLLRIAAMNDKIALSGVDLSPEMVRIAKERLGKEADVRPCNISSEQLPYVDNAFDRVVCMSAFHHFPEPKKALVEMRRVLKRGGSVIVADFATFFPLRQFYNSCVSKLERKGAVRLYSQSELGRLLEDCQFGSAHWEKVVNPFPLFHGFIVTAMPVK